MRGVTGLLLSLLVAGLCLWLAARNVDAAALRAAFAQFDARWLIPAVAVSLAIQVFRAWRWQLELRPLARVGLGLLWVVVSVAYMAINVLPARVGEVVRPWLLSRRAPVSFSNVVGNLLIEKTCDSLVIATYILIGLVTTPNLPDWVRRGALVPTVAAAVLAVLVVLIWSRGAQVVERGVARFLPARLGGRVVGVARAIVDGMRVVPDGRLVVAVLGVSMALWFLPILSSWIMIHAFALDVPFNAALMVFIFIGFGTALPQAPGMIGTYQYACVLALGLFGVPQPLALAYGLVLNAVQLTTIVVQGLVALPMAGIGVRDLARVGDEVAAER